MKVRAEGEVRLLGARILPFGVKDWQPEELEIVADRIEPLLQDLRFAEAVKLLDAWLLEQPPVEDALSAALKTLYAASGNVSISELADAQRISSRQLQRMFAAQLGIAPKTLAKLVRFALGWSTMLRQPDLTLAELALELGYSDQAHLTNDFRSLGRESPRVFRKRWGKP
jgi:transcriptional regulator GlxA family with amidase domain